MQQNGFRILIADDEPDILEILSYNLENEGYQVITASDGNEAIEKAEKYRPHLIILDDARQIRCAGVSYAAWQRSI